MPPDLVGPEGLSDHEFALGQPPQQVNRFALFRHAVM